MIMLKIDIKDIHIGSLLNRRVIELGMESSRICNFFKLPEEEIIQMYGAKSFDTEILLRWSKLLNYDFFRLYSQNLILYAPQGNMKYNDLSKEKKSVLPKFRKNVYTREVIDFILDRINKGEMSKLQVINEYRIPKTTLYKWISKYKI